MIGDTVTREFEVIEGSTYFQVEASLDARGGAICRIDIDWIGRIEERPDEPTDDVIEVKFDALTRHEQALIFASIEAQASPDAREIEAEISANAREAAQLHKLDAFIEEFGCRGTRW